MSFPDDLRAVKVTRAKWERCQHWSSVASSIILGALIFTSPLGAGATNQITNGQIVTEIQDLLYHAHVFKHGQVQVSVNNGVATLTGRVDSIGVKTDAQNAAMQDEDIVRVANDVQVDTSGVTPDQILERARHRLSICYAYTVYDHVDFKAQGNTLVVSGQVTQPYKKQAIAYSISHIKGVAAVDNEIQVLSLSAYDDDLRMRVARAIYDDPYFSDYVDAGKLPIHIVASEGMVTLEGVVATPEDRSRAEQDARIVTTVDTVSNHLRLEG